jgi:hypothetical protein
MSVRLVIGILGMGGVVVALQSCTAVLGMERATLELSDGAAGSPAIEQPTIPCATQPTDACTNCLEQNCGTDYATCIDDASCRPKFDAYARCITDSCNPALAKDCGKKTLGSLFTCFSRCGGQCAGTLLASACDLYCHCMPVCDTEEFRQADPNSPVQLGQACSDKCAEDSLTPGLVECMRSHCELSRGAVKHCEHATGINPVCASAPAAPSAGCLGKNEPGWFCDTHSDCCSDRCVGTGACE